MAFRRQTEPAQSSGGEAPVQPMQSRSEAYQTGYRLGQDIGGTPNKTLTTLKRSRRQYLELASQEKQTPEPGYGDVKRATYLGAARGIGPVPAAQRSGPVLGITKQGQVGRTRSRFQRGDAQQAVEAAFGVAQRTGEPRYVVSTHGGFTITEAPIPLRGYYKVLPDGTYEAWEMGVQNPGSTNTKKAAQVVFKIGDRNGAGL